MKPVKQKFPQSLGNVRNLVNTIQEKVRVFSFHCKTHNYVDTVVVPKEPQGPSAHSSAVGSTTHLPFQQMKWLLSSLQKLERRSQNFLTFPNTLKCNLSFFEHLPLTALMT